MAAKGGIPVKKNLCAVFLVIVFLVSVPFVSSAMTQDEGYQYIHNMFAETSDEDLKALLTAVQVELMYRGYTFDINEAHPAVASQKEVTVPPGTYAVGIDIPEGEYTVCTNGYISMLTIKDISGNFITAYSLSSSTPIGKLVIEDGQYVEIVGESVIFKPYQGLGF